MKQEKSKMDDLEEKDFGSIGQNTWKSFRRIHTLAKVSQNIFAYSFVSEHSMHFF